MNRNRIEKLGLVGMQYAGQLGNIRRQRIFGRRSARNALLYGDT
jgi:hypothetical protein